MSLDFSMLKAIPFSKGAEDAPSGSRGEEEAAPEEKHYNFLESEKKEREKARQMFANYQRCILRAGTLRERILRGIKLGQDPIDLLLKAIDCISLMTGDRLIYTQAEKDIMTVYGWKPKDPEPEKDSKKIEELEE